MLMTTLIQPNFQQCAIQYNEETPIQTLVAQQLFNHIIEYNYFFDNQSKIWLDVGAGTGKLSQHLLNYLQYYPKNQLYILDKSTEMLSIFYQNLPTNLPVIPLVADMQSIPLNSNNVDVVMSSFALHWLNPTVLNELVRVIKIGGQLHVAIPVAGSFKQIQQHFPRLPIFPFLSAESWKNAINWLVKQRHGKVFYDYQQDFSYSYDNLRQLLFSLKKMGGAVSGQPPLSTSILRQYLKNNYPINLDYRILLMGVQL